jgi:hypothetical protein
MFFSFKISSFIVSFKFFLKSSSEFELIKNFNKFLDETEILLKNLN